MSLICFSVGSTHLSDLSSSTHWSSHLVFWASRSCRKERAAGQWWEGDGERRDGDWTERDEDGDGDRQGRGQRRDRDGDRRDRDGIGTGTETGREQKRDGTETERDEDRDGDGGGGQRRKGEAAAQRETRQGEIHNYTNNTSNTTERHTLVHLDYQQLYDSCSRAVPMTAS